VSNFVQRLLTASQTNRSLVCVGLDPNPSLMAIPDLATFNRSIVDATKDLVCAFKPNLAFYEAIGPQGLSVLKDTVSYIRAKAPQVIVIGDAKRGDVDSTNIWHARTLFETWDFDAATVNVWGGGESLKPFLEYEDKGILVWCRSSNPGASEFQDLSVLFDGELTPLYQLVAARAARWNQGGNVGVVAGATYPAELEAVRTLCQDMPILVPGVGVQQGDVRASVTNGMDKHGRNLIISTSRSVLYASRDRNCFAEAARKTVEDLRSQLNAILEEHDKGW